MISIQTDWAGIKNFASTRSVSIQYVDYNGNYYVSSIDGNFSVETLISQEDPNNPDLIDFVANYKAAANKSPIQTSIVQTQPPYGAKTIVVNGVVHKLYTRFTGIQQQLSVGSNTIVYTATYPWAKLIGVEAVNCEALDMVDFKVYDNSSGAYSGVPNQLLNQFSFTLNLPKDFYRRTAQFDADIYAGMTIQVTYNSQSSKTVGINFLLDQVV
jgi:hypothetical protein